MTLRRVCPYLVFYSGASVVAVGIAFYNVRELWRRR